jgi:hypothetical protein
MVRPVLAPAAKRPILQGPMHGTQLALSLSGFLA